MKRYALIVAAGTGSRMNAGLPKQFLILSGKPVLFYSLQAFYNPETEIILVLSSEEIPRWEQLCKTYEITIPHKIVSGGQTRTESVYNGLLLLEDGLVAIHDGARPLVTKELIENCYESALKYGSGVASVHPKDSIRKANEFDNQAVNREDYRIMQTPQTFKVKELKNAFDLYGKQSSSDDATIYEKAGFQVVLVNGNYANLKITTPEDMLLAEAMLNFS